MIRRAALWSVAIATTSLAMRAQTLEPASDVALHLVADTDGDGRDELLVVTSSGDDGSVLRCVPAREGGGFVVQQSLVLHDPRHMLLAAADVHPHAGVELVVAGPIGTHWIEWPADPAVREPVLHPIARRARFTMRTGRPYLSPFVQDLDRDGRVDILLPTLRGVMPFLQEAPDDDGEPRFRAMDLLSVPVRTQVDGRGEDLDQDLQGSLEVPQIETADLDGDGRPDLVTAEGTKHAFWLQRDGAFRSPIEVDLTQFQDSTPGAAIAPGSTLVLGDQQLLQRGDVDGDRIPDFVIAHRRKVWTFLSSSAGPQFTKARTQAVADDVTAMLVVDLDEDERADLLTFQVQVPGIGSLLLGLVQSIDIDVKAVGYRSENGAFANTPAWRRVVTLRIPPILSLLGKQDELVKRFTDTLGKVRKGVRGPFTAVGNHDLALVRADGTAIDVFVRTEAPRTLGRASDRRMLRRLLFDDPNPVFDIDRVFGLLSGFLDDLAGELVGGDAPAATLPLRDPKEWRLADLLVAELDGAPRAEIVAVYERLDAEGAVAVPAVRAFDALAWSAAAK